MDTTLVQPVSEVIGIFGVPLIWLVAAIPVVVMIVNTVKALIPNWIQSSWYPVAGIAISLVYAIATLRPNWMAVIAGSLGLWITQWGSWVIAKRTAAAMGARPQ